MLTVPQLAAISEKIYSQIADAQLRLQLLKGVPAVSPRLSLFRRRLAIAFFFESKEYLKRRIPDLLDFSDILHHLQRPQYAIKSDTDYPQLAANISILDIGVDDGDPPGADDNPQLEQNFNARVDQLAKAINTIFTKIVDTGASHISRTEAKDRLEAFHSRLTFAVRTKRKIKKDIFGDAMPVGGVSAQPGSLANFLAKSSKAKGGENGMIE